jgi:hypothetical protein
MPAKWFRPARFARRLLLFVATLALAAFVNGSVQPALGTAVRNDSILSYEDAYNRAGQEGKPIFVLFTSQAKPAELQQLQSKGLLNDYLVVVADKNTEAGRKAFSMFNITGNDGVSVVEKNRQWQFARYERKLSSDELTKVAETCRNAAGYPTADPLVSTSAYVTPGQTGTAPAQSNYVMPGGQPVQQMQFYPAMGGCSGGSCGGGVIYGGAPVYGGGVSFGGGCANGSCGR